MTGQNKATSWRDFIKEKGNIVKRKSLVSFLMLAVLPGCMPGCPGYLYVKEQSGQGEYVEAEQNRKIKVLEAQAKLESAKMEAQAEIERAKGVAEANKIVGESLRDNEAYLRWLWVKELSDAGNQAPQVIYVPTEGGLPLLEAGKRGAK